LKAHFFLGEEARCYVYDSATDQWPEELISLNESGTIRVPNDESWILQGQLSSDGIPVKFPTRISSGTAIDYSEASIIVRYVRFTGFEAPVDLHADQRLSENLQGFLSAIPRNGGAFMYSGGGLNPETHTPKIAFEHVIFDHNVAENCGGAVLIAGRERTRSGISVTADHCIFYKNAGGRWGGGLYVLDSLPFKVLVNNTLFDGNSALSGAHAFFHLNTQKIGVAKSMDGANYLTFDNTIFTKYSPSYVIGLGWQSVYVWAEMKNSQWMLDDGMQDAEHLMGSNLYEDQKWNLTFHRVSFEDIEQKFGENDEIVISQDIADRRNPTGNWNVKILDSEIKRVSHPNMGGGGTTMVLDFMNDIEFNKVAVMDNRARADSTAVLTFPYGYTSSTRLIDSTFARNIAGFGGAVYFALHGGLNVKRCSFIENRAYSITPKGAAISVAGPGPRLFVEESVFLRNVAEVYSPGSAVAVGDYTVRFKTIVTANSLSTISVWRIDDGVIFGATFEHCEKARLQSLDMQQRGFPSVWPNRTSACANVSYVGGKVHSTTVSFSEGWHTFSVGILPIQSRTLEGLAMRDGFADIVGLVDPVFPYFRDDRDDKTYKGCNSGIHVDINQGNANLRASCPSHVGMWAEVSFYVAFGSGGAIEGHGANVIVITGSTFEGNIAAQGSSVASISAASIKVRNTTFNDSGLSKAFNAENTQLDHCDSYPCDPGWSCAFRDHSTFCTPCAANEIGTNGLECSACAPGRAPDALHSACLMCPLGEYSWTGFCLHCAAGKQSTTDRGSCVSCPSDQDSDAGASRCRCKAGYYNATFGVVSCPGNSPQLTSSKCQRCGSCLDCESTVGGRPAVLIRPGFALGPEAAAHYEGIQNGDLHVDKVFHSCGRDMCVGESADLNVVSSSLMVEIPAAEADGSARAVFETKFALEIARLLNVQANNITVGTIVWAAPGGARRSLQGQKVASTAVVSFTIAVSSSQSSSLVEAIEALRVAPEEFIALGTAGTALTSTLAKPRVSSAAGVQCHTGHDPTSPLCHLCMDGWVKGMDQMCFECENDTSISPWFRVIAMCSGIVLAGVILIGSYYAYQRYVARGVQQDAKELHWVKPSFAAAGVAPLAIYFKICISHYQILTQFSVLYDIVLPSVFQSWLDALSVVSLDLYTFVGIHCVTDLNMYTEFTISMAIPAVGLLLLFICYRARLWWIQRSSIQASTDIADAEKGEHNTSGEKDAEATKGARDQAVWLAISWLYMLYVILCRTTFQSFACHDISSLESFHHNDYSVDCNSDAYQVYVIAAAIFIGIYPVGILVLFVSLLYLNRGILSGSTSSIGNAGKWWSGGRETFVFLVDGYRSETYWYEIVDFSRKILLAGLVIFFDRGSSNQFFAAILISVVFLSIDASVMAYYDFRCNVLKILTSVSMVITLLCGFASKLDVTDAAMSEDTLGWILIFANFIIVLLILCIELMRRLLSIYAGVRYGIAYVKNTEITCPLTGIMSYKGQYHKAGQDEIFVAVKVFPIHKYTDAQLVHDKIQAMGSTSLLCPVYGCETERGLLFVAMKPGATTLSEHLAQFQTCPIAAKDFCSTMTKATLKLHMAGQSSWLRSL
jgi:hypothetical protein